MVGGVTVTIAIIVVMATIAGVILGAVVLHLVRMVTGTSAGGGRSERDDGENERGIVSGTESSMVGHQVGEEGEEEGEGGGVKTMTSRRASPD